MLAPRHHQTHVAAAAAAAAAVSRTTQYKKVTKPLLERKRRARINRCLDELKELMMGALEAEGENVSKLEKADILELTVRHLQRLSQAEGGGSCWQSPRFQAGFSQCATEACQFLVSLPGLDARLSARLVSHLSRCAPPTAVPAAPTAPLSVQVPAPPRSGAFSPPVSPCALTAPSSAVAAPTADHRPSDHYAAAPETASPPPPTAAAASPASLSSTPSASDLAKPVAGLLMTVPEATHQPPGSMWRPW
ncbi:enhancer of split mgamma protein-like [Schistocerca piceifrons]|uniref:enhancer of split mgamma protein-like n=1 Tax=Schistocerca piceifrons TaxID=274613 RepID=UPI001F5FD0EF|nr:enhancer of split mgamma protein-like [Schistocerca piceifrons]